MASISTAINTGQNEALDSYEEAGTMTKTSKSHLESDDELTVDSATPSEADSTGSINEIKISPTKRNESFLDDDVLIMESACESEYFPSSFCTSKEAGMSDNDVSFLESNASNLDIGPVDSIDEWVSELMRETPKEA